MGFGREVKTRLFRWTKIRVGETGASNQAVIEEVCRWWLDKDMCFTTVEHIGPQSVQMTYAPSFSDEDRKIILDEIKKKWPKAKVCFYGHEAITILRDAVCLDEYIQGSMP